jgi:hypothetical protein
MWPVPLAAHTRMPASSNMKDCMTQECKKSCNQMQYSHVSSSKQQPTGQQPRGQPYVKLGQMRYTVGVRALTFALVPQADGRTDHRSPADAEMTHHNRGCNVLYKLYMHGENV